MSRPVSLIFSAPDALREAAASIVDPEARFLTWPLDGQRIGANWQATRARLKADGVIELMLPSLLAGIELARAICSSADPELRTKAQELLEAMSAIGFDSRDVLANLLTDFGNPTISAPVPPSARPQEPSP